MIDSPYLLPFDLFQQLVLWLGTSMHAYRKGRRFLESNQVLLRKEIDRELERLIVAHVEEKVEMKQEMQHHQELLRTARSRGGSSMAIREAYINLYGGFALDLPGWLEAIEQQRTLLLRLQRPERTTKTHIQLLYQARAQAQADPELAPEITAEISNELGQLLMQSTLPCSHAEYLRRLEEMIACHKFALTIYTYPRYPLQYARTCTFLGTVYQRYGYLLHSQQHLEHGLTYYQSAQLIYTHNEYPEQWGMLQTLMGNSYVCNQTEGKKANLDYAVLCHEAALQVLTEEAFPLSWARTQINLGDTYQLYDDDAIDILHLEQALHCYYSALRIYTQPSFPREWADLHAKLATIFLRLDSKQEASHALGRTLVCYESTLQIYTIDAYPVEYASTQFCLGRAYHQQSAGDTNEQRQYLKLALQCYREALHIFTQINFPTEYEEVTKYLVQAQQTYLLTGNYRKKSDAN